MLGLSISHSIQQYDTEKLQKWPFEDMYLSIVICEGMVLFRNLFP